MKRNKGLTDYGLCREHTRKSGRAHGCKALSVQRKLKKMGYYCGQYQGVIRTDAPRDTVMKLLGR